MPRSTSARSETFDSNRLLQSLNDSFSSDLNAAEYGKITASETETLLNTAQNRTTNLGSFSNSDNLISNNFEQNNLEPNNLVSNFANLSISNLNIYPEMASEQVVTAADIVANLRIPDAIKDLPTFDGNPRLLYDFINNVEEIVNLFSPEVLASPYGKLLLRAIRNKVVGQANEVLNMYGTAIIWTEIKQNLTMHYSDKRNETSLIKDLHALKQSQTETVEAFYSKVIEIFSTISNHVQMHESNPSVIEAKQKLFGDMSLNVFLSGIKEPLGSTIRAMQPKSLIEAFSYCIKEQNCYYMKSGQNSTTQVYKSQNTSNSGYRPFQPLHPNMYKPTQFSQPRAQFTQQRPHFSGNNQSNPFYKPYTQPQYNQPRFAQPYTQKPNNYPRPQQIPRQSYPQPMELGSGQTRQANNQNNNFSRPSGLPNFNRELHNLNPQTYDPYETYQEQYDTNETDYYQPYEPQLDHYYPEQPPIPEPPTEPEIDDTNFQRTPSNNSDT